MKCRVRSCSRKGVNGGLTRIASIIMPCPLLMDNKKCGHGLLKKTRARLPRTATRLWNDPEYNNLRVGLASAGEALCRGLGSGWFTERFHRNTLVTHFQHGQVFRT